MHFSDAGLELLKRSEGFRDRTYLDAAGFPTIGYGHRLLHPESFPKGVTEAQATEILISDVRDAEQAVRRLVKVSLAQGQFDALVDFCFNLGQGKLAESTLLRELNAGRYEAAAEQLLRWDHAGAQENAGLKARRQAEMELWGAGHAETERAA
jgi:GH24 family phage-related lysozyme (muramidase)